VVASIRDGVDNTVACRVYDNFTSGILFMAIEFDCPHCGHHYRLKDELAGKTAACKNCRAKIVIPQPVTVSQRPAADVEAAAVALLAETSDAQPNTVKQTVEVECNYCGHKWTEPIARAGKNTLCPNMECRQRIKIPEPKDEGQYDWRQARSRGPSLAKQNLEKLEGVQDAADVSLVSGQALKEADVFEEELEPRPLREKLLFVLVPLALLAGLAWGIRSYLVSRTEERQDRLLKEAFNEFTAAGDEFPKTEAPLGLAILHIASGEHALRHNHKDALREAMTQFHKAQMVLQSASPSPARNTLLLQLATHVLALGGTEEQAREQIRIRWTPDVGIKSRPNERVYTVYDELRVLLNLVQSGTDPDFRTLCARQLTRELAQRDRAEIAAELIPLALFSPAERIEARALVALELYHLNPNSEIPSQIATELMRNPNDLPPSRSPSAQALLLLLKIDKAPEFISRPGSGAVLEPTRLAFVALQLLEGKTTEAVALAARPGRIEEQLRALVLCAEWLGDPRAALDAAMGIIAAQKGRKDVTLPATLIARLSQIAAQASLFELAQQFAEALPDATAQVWASGEAIRCRLARAPTEKGDPAWMEVADDVKQFRAGQAWARFWVARHNARLSGQAKDEMKAVALWPAPVVAFGKAGIALGLQDRDK
jgi:DNA-directed RNA polymerase subunit RPC12/RpoP